jgi:hypothetical protein
MFAAILVATVAPGVLGAAIARAQETAGQEAPRHTVGPALATDAEASARLQLTTEDSLALGICEGAIQLFKQNPGAIWPGYDLAAMPFIYYVPDRWTLLLNRSEAVALFEPYPADWPPLGTEARLHRGPYENLEGQLAFDLAVDSLQVAAVPFENKRPPVDRLAFVIHENFHQFQYHHFGEIPWEREELYPIDDRENTALAVLEMRLLADALYAAKKNDAAASTARVKEFIAVRNHRWNRSDPFVASYERGKELEEGTAKYVETRGLQLFAGLKYSSSIGERAKPFPDGFESFDPYDYILNEFLLRSKGESISPEDMPRNRIYPVGCAQGLLLDFFGIDWKRKAHAAGPEFTFAALFEEYLDVPKSEFTTRLNAAKETYKYSAIAGATASLLREYRDGYQRELMAFEDQTGYRFEVQLSAKNLTRSRSSSAKKWLVDRGAAELRSHFDVYSLESASDRSLLLQVRGVGILERNDWAAKTRAVVFFVPEAPAVVVNGVALAAGNTTAPFTSLEITGDHVKVTYEKAGTITRSDKRFVIDLIP